MQGDNNNRNRKKSGTPWVAVAIMLVAAVIGSIEDGDIDVSLVIGAIWLIVILAGLIIVIVKRKAMFAKWGSRTTAGASDGQSPVPLREVKRSVKEFVPKQFSIFTKDAQLEEMSFSNRRMETTCEYGDMNHIFSHDQQRRLQQLDAFLKNGIIEREEYDIMRKRYLKPVEYR